MMNLLFYIDNLNNKGGVERATVSLLNSLSQINCVNVSLLTAKSFDKSQSFELYDQILQISLNINNYRTGYIKIINGISAVIKDQNIDIVISIETMSLLFTYLPVKWNKRKLVVWEHFNLINKNGKRLRGWLRKIGAKKADMIVTLTERDEKAWKQKLKPKAHVTHIYNISPYKDNYTKYNLESKTAISIGRYVQVKGFDRLIDAWNLFETKYGIKDYKLNIIGYGEGKDFLQKLIASKDSTSISLIDGSDGVESHFIDASFYCLSSYFEGLPMVLIEAQSFNLPSIAFDIYTGPSEILINNSGILVEDNDIEGYVDAIYKLVENSELRSRYSINAQANKKRFNSNNIAHKWIEQLSKLI